MRKLAFNSLLLAIVMSASLIGAELMVRVFAPQLTYRFPRGLFVANTHTSYRLAPGYEGVLDTPEYRTRIRVTSQALRDDREYADKHDDELRILMLGDSFVMGVGVELEETLVEQLEDALDERLAGRDVEVVNMGVAGYSTRQSLSTLEEYGSALDPDLVVLGFFVGNDFTENVGAPLRVRDGYLVDSVLQDGIIPYRLRRFVKLHSQLYHLAWPIQRRLRGQGAAEARESAREIAEIFLADDDDARAITEPTLDALGALVRACERRSLPLAVVIIPDHSQVVRRSWDSLIRQTGMSPQVYAHDAPNRRVRRFLETLDVPVLDLLPAFHDAGASDSPQSLYLAIDKHWTAPGHDVATEAATAFLVPVIEGHTHIAQAGRR